MLTNMSKKEKSKRKRKIRDKNYIFSPTISCREVVQSSKYFHTPHKAVCQKLHVNSNSSERISIANHLLCNERYLLKAGRAGKRPFQYHYRKVQKLKGFSKVVSRGNDWYDDSKIYFFSTETFDPLFESFKYDVQRKGGVEVLDVKLLELIDSTAGCHHNLDDLLTFIKVKREWALGNPYSVYKDAKALQVCLEGHRLRRGQSHLDVCENYRTFGMYCSLNSRQVLCKENGKKYEKSLIEAKQVMKMYVRANEIATRVIPTDLLRGLRVAHTAVGWDTMETNKKGFKPRNGCKRNIWAGAAVSVNYISGSHVDDDFFLSCLTVICHDDNDVTVRTAEGSTYKENLPIAVYFCLPKLGVAVALRPGDYIVFNPREPHCVSMREKYYEKKQVYVMSFYLKSSIVGRNDNTMSNSSLKQTASLKYAFGDC
jgi:hypothetical protein